MYVYVPALWISSLPNSGTYQGSPKSLFLVPEQNVWHQVLSGLETHRQPGRDNADWTMFPLSEAADEDDTNASHYTC